MADTKNLFQTHPTKVITGKGRLSFAFIWDAREQDDGSKKYSTSFLIPKDDTRTITMIQQAANNAIIHGRAKGYWNDGNLPSNFKLPLRDGDLEADEKGEEYRGHYFINASSLNAPGIVDTTNQDILDRDEVYSGCFARLSINLYPFNTKGNKGIACGLNHVQKLADGEPLSASRSKPEDDFGSGDTYDQAPAYAQASAGYPSAHQAPAGYPPQQQWPPAGYQPQQPSAGYPSMQGGAPGGMQQPPGGYPPQYPPAGYPPAQQVYPGYPSVQQTPTGYPPQQHAQAGYPPQQPPAGHPGMQQAPNVYPPYQNPAASFSDQLAAASSILPPDLFGDELNKVA